MDIEKLQEAIHGLLRLKEANESYDKKRYKVAKIAFLCMQAAIREIEATEHVDIEICWNGRFYVDGKLFGASDFASDFED